MNYSLQYDPGCNIISSAFIQTFFSSIFMRMKLKIAACKQMFQQYKKPNFYVTSVTLTSVRIRIDTDCGFEHPVIVTC